MGLSSRPVVDIIIVAHNAMGDLPSLLRGLSVHTALPYKLFIWDNASSDGTAEYLLGCQDNNRDGSVTIVRNEVNEGFIVPNNRLYAMGRAPYVCLLNTDTRVHEGWDTTLHSVWNSLSNPGAVGYGGGFLDEYAQGCAVGYGPEVDYIEGWSLFSSRAVIGEAPFDEANLSFAYAEDSELCLRLRELGKELFAIPPNRKGDEPWVEHLKGVTTNKVVERGGDTANNLIQCFHGNHAYVRARHSEFLKSGRALVRMNPNESIHRSLS